MNTLGIMVDVSHAGEKNFLGRDCTSTAPVIATHSCVVCDRFHITEI